MSNIQTGEYIKIQTGEICRIKNFLGADPYFYNMNYYEIDIPYTMSACYTSHRIYEDYIVKHSKNIIDLIEAGDYVNGILVTGKDSTLLYTEIKGIDRSGYQIPISQYGEDIKSIVTKEMFEQMKYIVKEN